MLKRIILLAIIVIPMSALAQKFGHINPLPIMQAMPEYTKAQTELQELQKQYEGEMKIMQDELAKKSSEYDKQRDSLPQNIRQRRESELQDLYARLQQYAQESNQNMQKATQEKMAEISKKIETAIQEVGKAGGFIYIFDQTAGIPFINETLSTDVSAQVTAKLGLK